MNRKKDLKYRLFLVRAWLLKKGAKVAHFVGLKRLRIFLVSKRVTNIGKYIQGTKLGQEFKADIGNII